MNDQIYVCYILSIMDWSGSNLKTIILAHGNACLRCNLKTYNEYNTMIWCSLI